VPLAQVFTEAEAGRAKGFPLNLEARLSAPAGKAGLGANVVGCCAAATSACAMRWWSIRRISITGIGQPVQGDSIHNGAFDNATGIASLLELAAAFSQARERPRRSIVFLAVTGEEKGLQGSSYYAGHSTPAGLRVVADLNMDMYVMIGPLRQIVAYGAEHSTLGQEARLAVSRLGLTLVPDPSPESIFVRSDSTRSCATGCLRCSGGSLERGGREAQGLAAHDLSHPAGRPHPADGLRVARQFARELSGGVSGRQPHAGPPGTPEISSASASAVWRARGLENERRGRPSRLIRRAVRG
jgi:hypothetical protein